MKITVPHQVKSRLVEPKDLERVRKDAAEMQRIMDVLTQPHAPFSHGIFALAHSQVEEKDPLRFFVINTNDETMKREWGEDGLIVVNPVIVRHTKHPIIHYEGCVTFPSRAPEKVERWHKCDVDMALVTSDGDFIENYGMPMLLSSRIAQIFQHEIDHFNGKYVYTINWEKLAEDVKAAEKANKQGS